MPRFTLLLAAAAGLAALSACSRSGDPAARALDQPDPAPAGAPDEATAAIQPPRPIPTVQRVGGDMTSAVRKDGDSYRFGRLLIDTPLPVGYPAPTPPGAIEIKHYPSVRRAEVDGSLNPDFGMSMKFFPLFRHIQKRQIAMTSPVEMDYRGRGAQSGPTPDRWTMSFLYREPANGPTGEDQSIRIVDTQAVTVLAIGVRGRYSWNRLQEPLAELGRWLDAHPEWERAGDARALYYNGPDRPMADRWAEAQIPIRRKTSG